MSSLTAIEKNKLEKLFGMHTGYVLHFSNRTFENFFADFDINIYSDKYIQEGSSKAKLLRTFWKTESDHLVGQIIAAMIESSTFSDEEKELVRSCRQISQRLLSGKVNLSSLKQVTTKFDLKFIDRQIKRMEDSIESDPDLAIGTAKELIESCCKTILNELNVPFDEKKLDVPQLAKLCLENLKLVPDSVDPKAKGADVIKKILGNVGAISHGMAELRNMYGTGHGKSGTFSSLSPRHARLAVNSASAFVHFVFDTYMERTK